MRLRLDLIGRETSITVDQRARGVRCGVLRINTRTSSVPMATWSYALTEHTLCKVNTVNLSAGDQTVPDGGVI